MNGAENRGAAVWQKWAEKETALPTSRVVLQGVEQEIGGRSMAIDLEVALEEAGRGEVVSSPIPILQHGIKETPET